MNDRTNRRLSGDDLRADQRLDQVLQSIRQEPVPSHPDLNASNEFAERNFLHADEASFEPESGKRQRAGRRFRAWRTLAAAAAIMLIATLVFWPTANQSALARMRAALQKVQSISYTVMDYHASGDTWQTKVKIMQPDLSWSEQTKLGEGQVPNGLQISDWSQNKRLHIHHAKQQATFYEVSPDEVMADRRNQFIEKLRNVSEHATQDMGKSTLNDRPVHVFMMLIGDREFKVIVDDETSLPVRMEYEQRNRGFREVFQDFVFDGEMDESFFALKAPDGFKVVNIELEEPPEFAELLIVSSTTGIGPVKFGSPVESVIELLGEPSSRSDTTGFVSLHYNSLGLEIGFGATFDVPGGEPTSDVELVSIRCFGQQRAGASVHDFAGRTPEGIGIGSSFVDLVAAYGEAEMADGEMVSYLRRGMTFYLAGGKVTGFSLREPVSEEIEIIVNGDGSYTERVRQD